MMAEPTTRDSASTETESSNSAQTMQCVICDSRDLELVRAAQIDRLDQVSFSYSFSPDHTKTFQVMRCVNCTHLFCAPLPERIAESYEEVVDEEYLKHQASRLLAANAVLKSVLRHTEGRRLLDVGCATGDFLTSAKGLGFDAEGLELSSWSCGIARERGFTVHQETLSAFAERDDERYDVISLIGVIEHFARPRAELANLAKLLRPGGLIVMWTGDVSSWLPRLLGKRWWYWQGQHIQYFTHASMLRSCAEAGFDHVTTERYPFAATHASISNSLRRYPFHRLLSALLTPLFAMRPVVYLRLPGEMLFIGRKQD